MPFKCPLLLWLSTSNPLCYCRLASLTMKPWLMNQLLQLKQDKRRIWWKWMDQQHKQLKTVQRTAKHETVLDCRVVKNVVSSTPTPFSIFFFHALLYIVWSEFLCFHIASYTCWFCLTLVLWWMYCVPLFEEKFSKVENNEFI